MRSGEAIADIDRYGASLVGRLLDTIDPVRSGFERTRIDAAAHQLVWRHYMVTGEPAFGEAVTTSLRAMGRSSSGEALPEQTLGDSVQLLECLTWVWREARCPLLRRCGESIATRAVERVRRPGSAIGRPGSEDIMPDHIGLILVALVEAGSVFERRDWLALVREVFDEIVAAGRLGAAARLDDYAMMGRAAVRLFEAFGKPRYLELAVAWVATLDDAFWDAANGHYRLCVAEACSPASHPPSFIDAALPSGNALMIGVLARLHALTGRPHYVERAERLVDALHGTILRSGTAGATAVAGAQTLARLVSIKISGDPKLPETRELMRVALDCGLPDRMVLGPGGGDPAQGKPKAQIRIGTRDLAPISDAPELRTLTAPGGLLDESRRNKGSQDC